MITSAGGLLWRYGLAGVEVGLVHRPKYDDWSLAKGTLEAGESELTAAVREVREETGSTVAVTRHLGRHFYRVHGTAKSVAFWAMRQTGGTFLPNNETDVLEWLVPTQAAQRLSYDIDRTVLATFTAGAAPDAVVALVRHASAGKRAAWDGDDDLRPLDKVGRRQAVRLVGFLAPFAPRRVLSANPVRCAQTVAPLAEALDVEVEAAPSFSDETYVKDPTGTLDALRALGLPGTSTVVCSQGMTIPSLLEDLPALGGAVPATTTTRKGSVWLLTFAAGRVVSADSYPDAAR